MTPETQTIMVIKLGDVRSFIDATPALRAIRAAHSGAHITLLTAAPVDRLAPDTPFFDEVETLEKLGARRGMSFAARRIKRAKFDMIYDLDRSETSARLFAATRPFPPPWCGPQAGARLRHRLGPEDAENRIMSYLAQIALAGVPAFGPPTPDLSWLTTARSGAPSMDPAYFGLRQPYVLLVATGLGEQEPPRWPAAHFGALAARLAQEGVSVGVVADPGEGSAAGVAARAHRDVRDLAHRADLTQMAAMARGAAVVFGHADSSILHLAAPIGAPTIALVSPADDAAAADVPDGPSVMTLTAATPDEVDVDYVASFFRMFAGVGAPDEAPAAAVR